MALAWPRHSIPHRSRPLTSAAKWHHAQVHLCISQPFSAGRPSDYHLSGVLAARTAGLVVGNYRSSRSFSDAGRNALEPFWEYLAIIANSLISLLIGSQDAQQHSGGLWLPVRVAIVLVNSVGVRVDADAPGTCAQLSDRRLVSDRKSPPRSQRPVCTGSVPRNRVDAWTTFARNSNLTAEEWSKIAR